MNIIKRDKSVVEFEPNKILERIKKSAANLEAIDTDRICVDVIGSIKEDVSTQMLDKYICDIALGYTTLHPDYSKFAANVFYTRQLKDISVAVKSADLINKFSKYWDNSVIDFIKTFSQEIDNKVETDKNFSVLFELDDVDLNYLGIYSFYNMYCLKNESSEVIEHPYNVYFRTAAFLSYGNSKEEIFNNFVNIFTSIRTRRISLASPILMFAGSKNSSMISCSLHALDDDSMEGELSTFADISKHSAAGSGIGLYVSNLRSSSGVIKSNGGKPHGIIPFAKTVESLMTMFNQKGKRPGSCALYMNCWHKDIFDFIILKKPVGDEKKRARDLFLAINIHDNFMRAVETDGDYYLFCPHNLKEHGIVLENSFGKDFEKLYDKAVSLGIGQKIKARDLIKAIASSQTESGVPYTVFIDTVNSSSNHSYLGTIKSSNLCAEIVQYTDKDNTAQCCLGALPVFKYTKINESNGQLEVDYKSMEDNIKILVGILNKVIDTNLYSSADAKNAGKKQRAIGIGIMGLADLFLQLDYVFASEQALEVKTNIAQLMYFKAVEASCELAKNKVFDKVDFDMPLTNGAFHHEIHGSTTGTDVFKSNINPFSTNNIKPFYSQSYIEKLRADVKQYGVTNSMFIAYMPTVSTANLFGCTESFEPISSNLYIKVIGGAEFVMFNKYLIKDLEKIGLWNNEVRKALISSEGKLDKTNLSQIAFNMLSKQKQINNWDDKVFNSKKNLLNNQIAFLYEKYQTVYQIKQSSLIKMNAISQYFIDQSQSFNLYFPYPTVNIITSALLLGWKLGLKTGSYYLRSKPKGSASIQINKQKNETLAKLIQDKSIQDKPQTNDENDTCIGCSV